MSKKIFQGLRNFFLGCYSGNCISGALMGYHFGDAIHNNENVCSSRKNKYAFYGFLYSAFIPLLFWNHLDKLMFLREQEIERKKCEEFYDRKFSMFIQKQEKENF